MIGVSVYLVYVLEIVKFRRWRIAALRSAEPDTTEWEIDDEVEREIGTGEWEQVGR